MSGQKKISNAYFAFILIVGLMVNSMHVSATVPMHYNFIAHYEILSSAGESIGRYSISLKDLKSGVYKMTGNIKFSLKGLSLFRRSYLSIDTVYYDENGIKKYNIIEVDDGKRTQVTGSRSYDGTFLHITEIPDKDNAKATSKVIAKSSYDYSLYAFRFPLSCAQQKKLDKKPLKILTPRTGQVDIILAEPVIFDINSKPHDDAKCRLISKDASGKKIKDSWFLVNGILAFEKAVHYQLKLIRVQYGRGDN